MSALHFEIDVPCGVEEIRLRRVEAETRAEVVFSDGELRHSLQLRDPQPREALLHLYNGFESLHVYDRNREAGFHHDFGRFRIEYYADDKFTFDADFVAIKNADA